MKDIQQIYECDNCGFRAPEEDFPDAKDLWMRLTPGGTYTEKECPQEDCGALAFPQAPQETALPEGDYTLIDGAAWFTVGPLAIRIVTQKGEGIDDGVEITTYRDGQEMEDELDSTYIPFPQVEPEKEATP